MNFPTSLLVIMATFFLVACDNSSEPLQEGDLSERLSESDSEIETTDWVDTHSETPDIEMEWTDLPGDDDPMLDGEFDIRENLDTPEELEVEEENRCPDMWEGPEPPFCQVYDCELYDYPECWQCELVSDPSQNGSSCECPNDDCICENGQCVENFSEYLIPPIVRCHPEGGACQLGGTETGIWASYRKDYYFTDNFYNEYTDYPVNGGRFHIAAISAVTGTVTSVAINGQNVENLLVEPLMEWYHVWPTQVIAGEPVWFAFHSRNPAWDSATSGQITITTNAGIAIDGAFPVQQSSVLLTYLSVSEELETWLLHVKNTDSSSHHATKVLLNGHDVLASDIACISNSRIDPGESALWTIPSCIPITPGAPWTVVIEFEDTVPTVGVGRVIRPFFPIETWQNSSQCPFPGGNNEPEWDDHRDAGIDTFMFSGSLADRCDLDYASFMAQTAPNTEHLHLLMDDDFTDWNDPSGAFINTDAIAGVMTGDESDGELYEDDGTPKPAGKAAKARVSWEYFPELPVYNGAKTNGHVGTVAGMADIQGIDLYVAACAPHITQWGIHPPLRAPYDYLVNTRNNHMPWTTWQYTQGLSPAWNRTDLLGNKIHAQPNPQEILAQGLMVAAAGGKGLMWFQTNEDEAEHNPERWEAISQVSWMYRGVRHLLREGDITGMVHSGPDTLSEVIRSRDALVVVVINTLTTSGPTDISCGGALINELTVPHWVFAPNNPTIHVEVPKDFGIIDVFEVLHRETIDIRDSIDVLGRQITLNSVALDNTLPVRLYVLASEYEVRNRVYQEMNP